MWAKICRSQGIEHRDLHSGNILQDDLDNAYITDLGLSKANNEVCGILPYMAPEVLQGNPYTQAADIYSLGIIMAEISTGRMAFDGYDSNTKFAVKVCRGLQPEFTSGTPDCYIELAKRCMDLDPRKRPTIRYVNALVTTWIEEMGNFYNENKIRKQFLEADEIKPIIESPKHPNNMRVSKLINVQEILNGLEQDPE